MSDMVVPRAGAYQASSCCDMWESGARLLRASGGDDPSAAACQRPRSARPWHARLPGPYATGGPVAGPCPDSLAPERGRSGRESTPPRGRPRPPARRACCRFGRASVDCFDKRLRIGLAAAGGLMSFKKQHRDFTEIARELDIVRNHNDHKIAEGKGKWSPGCLLFAEGLLVLLTIERFLRIILGQSAGESATLPNLLEMATGSRLNLLSLPPWWTREQTIDAIKNVRNALMHGNYEQAAKQSGNQDREDYFRSGTSFAEVNTLFALLDGFCNQFDPESGKPLRTSATVARPYSALGHLGFVAERRSSGCHRPGGIGQICRRHGQFSLPCLLRSESLCSRSGSVLSSTRRFPCRVAPSRGRSCSSR